MKLNSAFLAAASTLAFVSFAQAETTLTIATVNNGDMIRMQGLTDDFTAKNPDIKLEWVTLEENVLRGAIETIKRDRPVIIVEQKRDMATARFGLEPLGAVKFLQSLGYQVAQEISGDYLMVMA